MKKKVLIGVVILVLLAVCLTFVFSGNTSYQKAYKNTKNLEDYTMNISTIVTVTKNDGLQESSTVDQILKVKNKGKKDMIYSVETVATSSVGGKVKSDYNSYIYYDDSYYYSYPGVKYKGPVEFDAAKVNIDKLSSVVLFEEEKITPYSKESDGYTYQIDYEFVSDFVKAMLQSAINSFEGEKFSLSDMVAGCNVEGKYITHGDMYIEYTSQSGSSVTVEVYSDLTQRRAEIEKPDETKYANIYN